MSKKIVLPHLENWQKDVYDAMDKSKGTRKKFVVVARRQCGKSVLAIIELIKFSLEYVGTSVLVEPTRAQSLRVMKQLCKYLDGSGVIQSINQSTLILTFVNGSEILFKSAEQRDSLRGFTVTNLLVIDEAAFIQDDIFQILYPTTDANAAPILIISTPLFCSGEFYKQFTTKNEIIKTFDWSKYDTSKYLPKETLEMYRQQLTAMKFQTEYEGKFVTEGGFVFQNISNCFGETKDEQPVVGGIDWGSGTNGDSTVLTLMTKDCKVTDIIAFNNLSPNEQVEKLASIINKLPTLKTIQVELNSIGNVFYDMLRRKVKTRIEGFTTTNESKRKIIEQLVSAFNQGQITIPNNAELVNQLQHYAMEKTSKGYTYNGITGYHDDYVISLALAYDKAKQNDKKYIVMVL
jgi:hypothetical protein